MTDARIRFSTEILRRLGEELNPSPDQSLLELVKNAYDADARHCRVELINTDEPGGTVLVSDDGDGMELEAIQNGWLVIGRSGKSIRERTRLERIPAGSKGLGRLAALRMGSAVRLSTRPRGNSSEQYFLRIDWSEFDGVRVVEDVVLPIEARRRASGSEEGTDIVLENLRAHLGRMDVKRLARAMILLADPFGGDPAGFEPVLLAPEFGDLEKLVRERYFEDADYHLIADLHADGHAEARVVDWRGAELFRAQHQDLAGRRKGDIYHCPEVTFHLWAFLLRRESFATRTASLDEVRTWLQSFGGVHVYHNGLRVAPYGNEGNDWLDMNRRRVQSPEERPGTNTSIGRVVIADEGELQQKTDRSGFIEDETFEEMKAFVQDALEWMARRRLQVAEQRRAVANEQAPRRASQSQKRVEGAIASIPVAQREPVQHAFEIYKKSRDREADQLRKEVQLYRTLSTAGITAATFAHESTGNPIKIIQQSVNAIQRRARNELKEKYAGLLQRPVDNIAQAVESLAVLGRAVLRLLDYEKRRTGKVELHKVVSRILESFEPFLAGRDVTLEQDLCAGAPYLRGTDAAVESILSNLLNNSLAALAENGGGQRKIRVKTKIEGRFWTLAVSDSGPGVRDIALEDIWLPGHTTRPNGTGLGLTIVRDATKDLGGTVEACAESDLGGAEFLIRLPTLGA
jgi:signal transduction histidine kinase